MPIEITSLTYFLVFVLLFLRFFVSGFDLDFMGFERTSWSSMGMMYGERKPFFGVHILLCGVEPDLRKAFGGLKLAPGKYEYPFRFQLPPDALPTVRGSKEQEITYQWNLKTDSKYKDLNTKVRAGVSSL